MDCVSLGRPIVSGCERNEKGDKFLLVESNLLLPTAKLHWLVKQVNRTGCIPSWKGLLAKTRVAAALSGLRYI